VRLIQATLRIRGKRQTTWFVTSLLDGALYPAKEVVGLYARRWRIETLFLQLKIRLSADVMRSKTPSGVLKELAARMTAMNVCGSSCWRRHSARPRPHGLSFVHALRAILAFAPCWRRRRPGSSPRSMRPCSWKSPAARYAIARPT